MCHITPGLDVGARVGTRVGHAPHRVILVISGLDLGARM